MSQFDELKPGDTASLVLTLTYKDIEVFAIMSGDINPARVDEDFAKSDMFHKVVAHGMWGGALISTVLGTQLPGPGTIYVDQSLHFHRTGKISRPRIVMPEIELRRKGRRYELLIEMTRGLDPIRTAVVHPVDTPSLLGALEAAAEIAGSKACRCGGYHFRTG